MELSSLPSIIFSPSADDISIPAEGDVVVDTSISDSSGATIFKNSSSYSPGADGYVHIAELSELVNAAVLTTFKRDSMLATGSRSASCELKVDVKGGASATSHALYMWRNHTELKPMFATQIRHRSVIEGQPMPVNVLTAGMSGLSLVLGAAYRYRNGNLLWQQTTIELDCSKDYFTLLADTDKVKKATNSTEGDTLLYYVLTLNKDGKQVDRIIFSVDRKTRPSVANHFIYLNFFGVPECVTFRGKDVEEQELDSDFGYAGREYVRLDPLLTERHKSHSGWLTSEERHAVYDFMSSPYAFVHIDGELRRIIITEVDSSVSRPANEPQSVAVTWRYSKERLMHQPYVTPNTGNAAVFTHPPFDKTFA